MPPDDAPMDDGTLPDDLDFDAMTDDEIVAYLMRRSGISREEATRNFQEACREVQAAVDALFAVCASGEIEATGINSKTGNRETIPPSAFKAR
jgi:hypothetical protein